MSMSRFLRGVVTGSLVCGVAAGAAEASAPACARLAQPNERQDRAEPRIEVTPARRSLVRLKPVTRAAVAGSRWKNSSSLETTSSKVQWTWASMRPGMTVAPAASTTAASGPA